MFCSVYVIRVLKVYRFSLNYSNIFKNNERADLLTCSVYIWGDKKVKFHRSDCKTCCAAETKVIHV